jgi:hypothetical protein
MALLLVGNPRTLAQDLAKVVSATKVEHNPVKAKASLVQNRLNLILNVSTQFKTRLLCSLTVSVCVQQFGEG